MKTGTNEFVIDVSQTNDSVEINQLVQRVFEKIKKSSEELLHLDEIFEEAKLQERNYHWAEQAIEDMRTLLADRARSLKEESDLPENSPYLEYLMFAESDYNRQLGELERRAEAYFVARICRDLSDYDPPEIVYEVDRLLNERDNQVCFRNALIRVKGENERLIERELKRMKQKSEWDSLQRPAGDKAEEELNEKLSRLDVEIREKQRQLDGLAEATARDRGLSIRRLLLLLDEMMPEFKDANDNVARGEFAYMLTGLGGRVPKNGEKIRKELSYNNTITNEDRDWLDDWKARLKKVPKTKGVHYRVQ